MAKYTVELGSLIESNFDLGLKDYPIYKEEYREPLNELIKEHYYFREIGLETPQLFKRFLNRKMQEIMPYYNQLYRSEDVEFNPLYNVDMKETFELVQQKKNLANAKSDLARNNNSRLHFDSTSNDKGDMTTKSLNDNENINVESDTPQSELTKDEIRNNKYASKVNYVTGKDNNNTTENRNNNSTQSGSNETNEDSTEVAKNEIESNEDGKQSYVRKTEGSSAGLPFSKAIMQWRKIMININMQIVEELEPLFIQVW